MQNPPLHRPWLIPGIFAAILFVGGVANNILASQLETSLKPYLRWVWLTCAIALVVTVMAAIVEARRKDQVAGAAVEETCIVNASGSASTAIDGKITFEQTTTDSISSLHQLRAPVGDFVGREKETETLMKALLARVSMVHAIGAQLCVLCMHALPPTES